MKLGLIGVTGPAGAGKDTVGNWLCTYLGYEAYAMARPLKAGMAAMGFPEPKDRDQKEATIEGFDFSWRDAAQKLGTEWGRDLDKDIWLKLAERKVKEVKRLVITDVRFENEAAMVRDNGGIVLHLTGRGVDLGKLSSHASEKGLSKYSNDWILSNADTMDKLHNALGRMFNE